MASVQRISRFGFVNTYLLADGDGLTVIDTMLPGSAKKILAAAREAGPRSRAIVLTHAHGDHVGSLDALKAELPDAEVIISARDARLLDKDRTMDAGRARRQAARRLSGHGDQARPRSSTPATGSVRSR